MTSEKEQLSNRRWMIDLLSRPIMLATGVEPESFFTSLTQPDKLSRGRFFELSNIDFDHTETQFWFDDALVTEKSLNYLKSFIPEDNLIVGYEISEQTRRLLTRINVTYVDIWLHPIRYLDDILFAMDSNSEQVREQLHQFDLDPEIYYLYANRLRVQAYKGYRRVNLKIPGGSALFVGQMMNDKSLIQNGQPLTLLDYSERFEKLANTARRIYYSRHPYLKSGDGAILEYLKKFPNVEQAPHPSYLYLCSDNIDTVMTISSSVGLEGQYFGKNIELLFRPVLDLGTGSGQYTSIYQHLVNPKFWRDILEPVASVSAKVADISFLDPRDKLRDMLAFYWSYQHIDKLESLRQDMLVMGRKQTDMTKKLPGKKKKRQVMAPFVVKKKYFDEFDALAARADVISFDLFDTLVTRPVFSPDSVPKLIDLRTIEKKLDVKINGALFQQLRQNARHGVLEETTGSLPQEVLLKDRYAWVARQLELPGEAGREFEKAEEAVDEHLLRRYSFGMAHFERAQKLGKPIVITSDTYYSRDLIERVLKKHKISGFKKLFVSSEVGLTKHAGDMFLHLAKEMDVAPDKILHVGDNAKVDGENGRSKGLHTHIIPSIATTSSKSLVKFNDNLGDVTLNTIGRGLIRTRFHDDPNGPTQTSYSGGVPARVGYAFFGPVILGYAKWILDRAKKKGIGNLLFLARDGRVVYDACCRLAPYYDKPPKLSYVYASRRGVSLPLVKKIDDIRAMMKESFSPSPLGNLLQARFGLQINQDTTGPKAAVNRIKARFAGTGSFQVDNSALEKIGYKGPNDIIRPEDGHRLDNLIDLLGEQILDIASDEREVYLDYLEQFIDRKGRNAVVDIGHRGSLQKKISTLLKIDDLGGFYFATHSPIKQNLSKKQWHESYYVDELPLAKQHIYNKHILMFELFFLNDEGSFVRMNKVSGKFKPQQMDVQNEMKRVLFAQSMHRGVDQFIRALGHYSTESIVDITTDPEKLCLMLINLFEKPAVADAKLFEGMTFENSYAGRPLRYVIAPASMDENERKERSIWKEGIDVLLHSD